MTAATFILAIFVGTVSIPVGMGIVAVGRRRMVERGRWVTHLPQRDGVWRELAFWWRLKEMQGLVRPEAYAPEPEETGEIL